jgi:hypothetical protein
MWIVRVLLLGVLDRIVWLSSLSRYLVSSRRQVPLTACYIGRFCHKFTRGSGTLVLVGGGPIAAVAQHGKEAAPRTTKRGARSAREPLVPVLRTSPPVSEAVGAIAMPCQGPLGPPRCGLLIVVNNHYKLSIKHI